VVNFWIDEHKPEGRERAPGPRYRLDHPGHLLARNPGAAGGGSREDRWADVGEEVGSAWLKAACEAQRDRAKSTIAEVD